MLTLFPGSSLKGKLQLKMGQFLKLKRRYHKNDHYILPGLVDSHVHIESSMTVPSVFARMAVARGTVASVSDPHEIANVMGEEGINYMLEDARRAPLKIYFGVPSCVPATPFESAGAVLDSETVDRLLAKDNLYYLSEMMNFPGVISGFPEVMAKLESAKKVWKSD